MTARRKAEEDYQTLFREMLDGFALHELLYDKEKNPANYRFLAVNPAFERITGLKAEEIVGKTVLDVIPSTERHRIETYGKVVVTGEPVFFENFSSGLNKHFAVTAFRPAPHQFACIFSDITERKREEEEKAKLEAQLHQSQKMESVGRLAGGVAHDFNNMLGVILGHAEIAMDQVDPALPLHADLMEIRKAAERSADLTRQLLAFARKQVVAPKVLDMNDTISGMLKMLQRLI
ncbi:MAG: PAS domain S-box protein [Deltaproteobacteria bacterium]